MLRAVAECVAHRVRLAQPQTGMFPTVVSSRYYSEPSARTNVVDPEARSDFGNITIGQVMKEKAESGAPTAALFWAQPQVLTLSRLELRPLILLLPLALSQHLLQNGVPR